ncbi:MAG: LamG domain-containing protein [Spirochaetota bacterium]|nr:LamG domain-containing protein [Spirochaetota bacterium]
MNRRDFLKAASAITTGGIVATTPACRWFDETPVTGSPIWTGHGQSLPVSGARLWLRADLDVVKDSLNNVYLWKDQSGNEFHGSLNGPAYVSNILNGHPVIRFNGTIVPMTLNDNLLNLTELTIFILSKASANSVIFNDYGNSPARFFYINTTAANTYSFIVRDTANNAITATGTANSSVFNVICGRLRGQTFDLYYNGTLDATNTNTLYDITTNWTGEATANTVNGVAVGSHDNPTLGLGLTGDIAELIVYPSALIDSQRLMVESYLKSRYGL